MADGMAEELLQQVADVVLAKLQAVGHPDSTQPLTLTFGRGPNKGSTVRRDYHATFKVGDRSVKANGGREKCIKDAVAGVWPAGHAVVVLDDAVLKNIQIEADKTITIVANPPGAAAPSNAAREEGEDAGRAPQGRPSDEPGNPKRPRLSPRNTAAAAGTTAGPSTATNAAAGTTAGPSTATAAATPRTTQATPRATEATPRAAAATPGATAAGRPMAAAEIAAAAAAATAGPSAAMAAATLGATAAARSPLAAAGVAALATDAPESAARAPPAAPLLTVPPSTTPEEAVLHADSKASGSVPMSVLDMLREQQVACCESLKAQLQATQQNAVLQAELLRERAERQQAQAELQQQRAALDELASMSKLLQAQAGGTDDGILSRAIVTMSNGHAMAAADTALNELIAVVRRDVQDVLAAAQTVDEKMASLNSIVARYKPPSKNVPKRSNAANHVKVWFALCRSHYAAENIVGENRVWSAVAAEIFAQMDAVSSKFEVRPGESA